MAIAALTGEYEALKQGCGLVDRSERGKLLLSGADAAEFLNGQVSNDVLALEPGRGCYAALLNAKGKMLGDMRVVRVPEDDALEPGGGFWLDTERVALQPVFDTLRRHLLGHRAELGKRTLQRSLLSLIGPDADKAAARAVAPDNGGFPKMDEDELRNGYVAGAAVLFIGTLLGIDVICASEQIDGVAAALLEAGAAAVGEEAAEVVRVESGRPRYGVELDDSVIPQEAGLNERAVSLTKGCYVGQETVARLYYKGKPNRHLRGLRFTAPARAGEQLRAGERVLGSVGSAVSSPRFGPIGLALVRREAAVGDVVQVGEDGIEAEITCADSLRSHA